MSIKSILYGQFLKQALKNIPGKTKWLLLLIAAAAAGAATAGIGGDTATDLAQYSLSLVCGDV